MIHVLFWFADNSNKNVLVCWSELICVLDLLSRVLDFWIDQTERDTSTGKKPRGVCRGKH